MTLTIGLDGLIVFLLAFARAVAWLALAPPFSSRIAVPPSVRVGLAAGLGWAATPRLAAAVRVPTSTAALVWELAFQALIGAGLGLLVSTLLSAVSGAAEVIGLFGGLTLPAAIDPLTAGESTALGQFYQQLTVVLLFGSGGELLIVDGFLRSFGFTGSPTRGAALGAALLAHGLATLFTSALEIAAPMVAVLFLAQIALGLLAKAAPTLNVFFLGLPLQVLLLFVLLTLGIKALPAAVTQLALRAVGGLVGIG